MGFWRGVGRTVKPFVDVPKWFGYQQAKKSTASLWGLVRNLFIPQQSTHQESFEETIQRQKLTEEDLSARLKELYWLAYIYLGIALCIFAYVTYLFFQAAVLSGLITMVVGLIVLSYAFRKRFWYFQVKTRHLGYSFWEWVRADLQGKHDEKDNG